MKKLVSFSLIIVLGIVNLNIANGFMMMMMSPPAPDPKLQAQCDDKYPGTTYRTSDDKCICSNNNDYDNEAKSCALKSTPATYILSPQDTGLIEKATAKIEKIIEKRGKSIRKRVISLLQGGLKKYENNPRMKAILEKTIENINSEELSLGSFFGQDDVVGISGSIPKSTSVSLPTQSNAGRKNIPITKITCADNQHVDNKKCVSNARLVDKTDGVLQESWDGDKWKFEKYISCKQGSFLSGTTCYHPEGPDIGALLFGGNKATNCSSIQHLEGGVCVGNVKNCSILNGNGEQTWGNGWGNCAISSCNTGYENKNGSCILKEVQSTPISTGSINSNYPGCNTNDIVIGNQIWSACNIGATTAGTGISSYGNYIQWGRNDGLFSTGSADWQTQNDNSWGGIETTNATGIWSIVSSAEQILMKGPCATDYHVPTIFEWVSAIQTITGKSSGSTAVSDITTLQNSMKLPMSGARIYSHGSVVNQGLVGNYWSSSLNHTYGYSLGFDSTAWGPVGNSERAFGFSVRCIKN